MSGFARPAVPTPCLLASDVLLLFWDDGGTDQPRKLAVSCAGTNVPAPVLRLSAPLESGGSRWFLAFAMPAGGTGPVVVQGEAGTLFSLAAPNAGAGPVDGGFLDAAAALSGLTNAGRVRLVRFLGQTCRTAFGASDDSHYAANMRRLVDEISLRPLPVEPRALLSRHHVLASGTLPAALGDNAVVLTIDSDGGTVHESLLQPSVCRADETGKRRYALYLAIPRTALARDVRIIVVGSGGVAIRRMAASAAALEPVVAWLAARRGTPSSLRNYALDCLTSLGPTDEAAEHAARELMVLASPDGIAIEPDCAIAAGERLFFSGRLFDPRDLVTGIEIRIGRWSARADRRGLATFPCAAREAAPAGGVPAQGLAMLASGTGRVPVSGMAHIALQLRSGALIDAGTVPLLTEAGRSATALLRALPAAAVTDATLRDIVAPALDALADKADRSLWAKPEILSIGSRRVDAQTSIVLPLSGDLGVFTTWAAALGGEVWDAVGAELVFVQPATAPLAESERALASLHRRFGVPSRLVRVGAADGGDFLNPGAQAARGDRLVFLGAACLPQERNAMAALLAALGEDSGCGVAGGAVLDPSGAIRHAGFAPPREGRLTRRHAGFPAPALYREVMRPVFACSSAFLGVRRAVFEATGGFSHAYRTRDWADADFCLRARAQGHGVVFVPQARVVGYGGDRQARTDESAIADRVDALRFARERTNEMTDWREENPPAERPGAEQPQAAQAIAVIDPRWAA